MAKVNLPPSLAPRAGSLKWLALAAVAGIVVTIMAVLVPTPYLLLALIGTLSAAALIAHEEWGMYALIVLGLLSGVIKRLLPEPELFAILYDLLGLALLLIVGVKRLSRRRPLAMSRATLPMVAFMLWAAMEIVNPALRTAEIGLFGWRILVSAMLFHFIGYWYFTNLQRIRRFIGVLVTIGVLVGAYGLYQGLVGFNSAEVAWIESSSLTGSAMVAGRYRAMSTLPSMVDFASCSVLVALLLVSNRRLLLPHRWRWLVWPTLFLLLGGLIASLVRTAWIALLAGLTMLWWLSTRQTTRGKLVALGLGILLLISLPLITTMIQDIAASQSERAFMERIGSLSNPIQDKSIQDRLAVWGALQRIVEQSPLGIGIGSTGATSYRFSSELLYGRITPDNSYLKILLELGWPGLLLFIWFMLNLLWTGQRVARRTRFARYHELAAGLTAYFTAYLILLFNGEYIELNPLRTLTWVLSGLLLILPQLDRQYDSDLAHQSHC
jgi:putative inorganic carbon (HCO3(-)) transporter